MMDASAETCPKKQRKQEASLDLDPLGAMKVAQQERESDGAKDTASSTEHQAPSETPSKSEQEFEFLNVGDIPATEDHSTENGKSSEQGGVGPDNTDGLSLSKTSSGTQVPISQGLLASDKESFGSSEEAGREETGETHGFGDATEKEATFQAPAVTETGSGTAEKRSHGMTSDEKQHVVLIIGKTGNGKSTLGNILIGESVKEPFKVGRGLSTTTLETQCYESNDGQMKVVDTPDINEWHDYQKKQSEVSKWKHLTAPYPDAILLAVNCDVRYTPEEHAIYREIKKLWKEYSFCERLIVAFTFGDLQDQDIAEELKFSGQELKSVLEDAGERYIVFNGKASDDNRKEQRLKLLQKIGQDSVPGLLSTIAGATGEERRFLVVGKTGNGKSSLCNILVGKKLFKVGKGLSTTTTHTQDVAVSSPWKMKVVDTPDISEWHDDQKKQSEVSKWKHLTAPYPDAILLAVNCDVRYTPEEHAIYREIKKLWKEGSFCNRLIVAFTFGDLQDQDIAEELKFSGQELKSVLEDAGGRYVVFNSKASEVDKTQQRERLLSTLQMCKIPGTKMVPEADTESCQGKMPRTSSPKPRLYPDLTKLYENVDAKSTANMASKKGLEQIRVVMIGKTGAGKSSLGNSILGPKHFKVGRGLSSETILCSFDSGSRNNFDFQVVDTPGLCDTHRKEEDIYREVGKSVALAAPGPHIILMVLRCDRRFTKEEYGAYVALKKLFSDQMCKHMIIIFNGLDTFAEDDDDEADLGELRAALEAEMAPEKASKELRQVLSEAKGGYFGMNNKASTDVKEKQMTDLVEKIVTLMRQNGNACYSSDLVQEINRRIDEMVQQRMQTTPKKTREQVTEDLKRDIKEERVEPGFFGTLAGVVKSAAAGVANAAGEICAVM